MATGRFGTIDAFIPNTRVFSVKGRFVSYNLLPLQGYWKALSCEGITD